MDQFTAQLTGLPAGTTIHYRAVAVSDFGTFAGDDQTVRTQAAAGQTFVGAATVSGTTVRVPVSCTGQAGATCQLNLALTVTERFKGRRLIGLSAPRHVRTHRHVLVVGSTHVTLNAGQSGAVLVALTRAGRHLLACHHHLVATLGVAQVAPDGRVVTVSTQQVTFKTPHHHRRH